jgi:RNA polymerase sigma-70 factor (ECF subfamily)
MFTVCLRYAKSREEGEDILQDGFTKVFEFLHQYQSKGSFEGWIRKIIVNTALQRLRSKPQIQAVLSIDTEMHISQGHEEILSTLGTRELLTIIQQLSPAYRMVFNLYVFEGMKHREIASALGISEGTSKSNLSDARTILRENISKAHRITNTEPDKALL